uniref:Uncharacterized protein n=1 Tax=Romanomermis culicivorax TaxID=13658 RepID=A0A915KXA6_ROMCU
MTRLSASVTKFMATPFLPKRPERPILERMKRFKLTIADTVYFRLRISAVKKSTFRLVLQKMTACVMLIVAYKSDKNSDRKRCRFSRTGLGLSDNVAS